MLQRIQYHCFMCVLILLLSISSCSTFNSIFGETDYEDETLQWSTHPAIAEGLHTENIVTAIEKILEDHLKGLTIDFSGYETATDYFEPVNTNETQLAIVASNSLFFYYNGLQIVDEEFKNLRAIAALYEAPLHIVAREDAGILRIEDLQGKRVAAGPENSSVWIDLDEILFSIGLKREDIQPKYLSPLERAFYFKIHSQQDFQQLWDYYQNQEGAFHFPIDDRSFHPEKVIDCFFAYLTEPDGWIEEKLIDENFPFRLIPLDRIVVRDLTERIHYLEPAIIRRSSYPTQLTQDINTVSISYVLITNKETDDDLVYDITKQLMGDNNRNIIGSSAIRPIDIFDVSKAREHIPGNEALIHPGALRYYEEIKAAGEDPWYLKWGEIILAIAVPVFGVGITLLATKLKRRKLAKAVLRIDRTYASTRDNLKKCANEMIKLKEEYFQLYTSGKYNDVQYHMIEKKILGYLRMVKRQIQERKAQQTKGTE